MLINFQYNGKNYLCFEPEDAIAAGVPESVVAEEVQKAGGVWPSDTSQPSQS